MGGGPVNLVGDRQGGWLAAIYAALHPEQINTLTIAGRADRLPRRPAGDRRLGGLLGPER
ncbi:MAG: hypothetical protein WKF31_13125 [Thermoleophilaceae bacterium]